MLKIELYADNGEDLTPLEFANSLINKGIFNANEIKELAEYLNVYYRHNNKQSIEPIEF